MNELLNAYKIILNLQQKINNFNFLFLKLDSFSGWSCNSFSISKKEWSTWFEKQTLIIADILLIFNNMYIFIRNCKLSQLIKSSQILHRFQLNNEPLDRTLTKSRIILQNYNSKFIKKKEKIFYFQEIIISENITSMMRSKLLILVNSKFYHKEKFY